MDRQPLQYRPEIDGLRAIAVIPVIIYHLKIPMGDSYLFSGGFLGVDIFFVISGFLITHILMDRYHANGRIDFADFYTRRARRILPPLLLVIAFSIVCSLVIQLPHEVEVFAGSVIAGLGFVSNIFWFFEQNEYGAQTAVLQPLLHLWSLAIEEQFYLAFPIVLLILGSIKRIGAGLIFLLLAAFVVAQLTVEWNAAFAFYSPTSRAWELLAGSVLAWAEPWNRKYFARSMIMRILPFFAFAYLAYAFLNVELSQIDHPGIGTVPVILATAVLIVARERVSWSVKLMSSAPFVLCGKLSYSLYLWHFPIFAFGRMTTGEPGLLDMGIWLILTFAFTYAGYKFVETPFRSSLSTKTLFRSLGAAVSSVLLFAAAAFAFSGFPGRMPATLAAYAGNEPDNEALRSQTWSILTAVYPPGFNGEPKPDEPSQAEFRGTWFDDSEQCKVLIVGDSHGKDIFNALYLSRDSFPDLQFARFGMVSQMGGYQRALLFQSPNFDQADVVALSFLYVRHDNYPVQAVRSLIDEIQARGKQVVVIGNTAQFESVNGIPLFDWMVRREKSEVDFSRLNKVAFDQQDPDVTQVNQQLAKIASDTNSQFIDRWSLVCDADDKSCQLATPAGKKALYDYGHWTLDGAEWFGSKAAHAGWFAGTRCSSNSDADAG